MANTKKRGIGLSLNEARLVAAKIDRKEPVDPQYLAWIMNELCQALKVERSRNDPAAIIKELCQALQEQGVERIEPHD